MKKNGCVAKFMHYWPIACLLIIPTVAQAVTVSLVQDVSTANSTYREPGSSVTTGDMASYLDKEGFGNIVSNYVGNVTWGGSFTDWVNQAALKFTLPATSSILSTAKLHLPVTDIQGSAWVTVTLTDDNAWQQTNVSTTSTYPSLVNAKTILSTQSVSTSGDVALSLDTANLRSKITSSGTTTITLILTGNTTTDNYFNFVADDDASTDQAYLVLTFQPQVQSVSVPSSGTYKAGDALYFTVTFDSTVVVTGTPRIPVILNTGGTVYASYVSGSNSNNLAFRYTVASGNVDADGVSLGSAISLNSGTIKSNNGDDAELNLYSVAATTSVLVDGVTPTISTVSPPSSGTYIIGQNLDYIVNFDDAVNVVISSGTPYLTLDIGGSSVQALYSTGTGTSALTFRYTVVSGDLDANGVAIASNITLNSGTIKDAAGNNATVTFTGSTATGVTVDAVAPTISSVTGPSAGTYALGDTLWFTATFSEEVTVTSSPYIPLT
ncbi:MAG: hypothetical protein M0P13_08050, partial [Fibrobacteraceae bacterium]|nr:hypothetical protein [Fibrobacteraceae bacterium]